MLYTITHAHEDQGPHIMLSSVVNIVLFVSDSLVIYYLLYDNITTPFSEEVATISFSNQVNDREVLYHYRHWFKGKRMSF